MKSKFGVITFAPEQMKSEEIVLREPNFLLLENGIRESKRTLELGKKVLTGLLITTATVLVAGLLTVKLKPIPVKTTKRFWK